MSNDSANGKASKAVSRHGLDHGLVLLLTTGLFGLLYNRTFWTQVLAAYPLSEGNLAFVVAVAVAWFAVTCLLLMVFDLPYVLKPVLVILFLSAATSAYFMDTYGVVIDGSMLRNALLTDRQEVRDLLNLKFFAYVALLGVLPSVLVVLVRIRRAPTVLASLLARLKLAGVLVAILTIALFTFNKDWASFLREHKPIRRYANPDYIVYSMVKFASAQLDLGAGPVKPLGQDARIARTDPRRRLIVMVVGEAARADHFSLNGYPRETNPLLAKESVISFRDMYSNGTSTANSVPCMFSTLDHDTYSDRKARSSENLLDVLRHAGVSVVWRDNNSDSKGVASRVTYEDFKSSARNPVVDEEPRDVGMLSDLQGYVDQQKQGDIFIVLHQMGNHGPAYHKRYPRAFERFTPVCRTNELGRCSPQEIINAYDNALLYTDYFLSEVIAFLKRQSGTFETAMLYSSDHGESLGEKGLYLHGLPYRMAPREQKHVATVFWLSEDFGQDPGRFRAATGLRLSHSSLFHTVLGLLEVETRVYDPKLDIARQVESNPLLYVK